ncbi:MAG: heparinase II/III family protein [Planctomycetota bacterium]
MIPVKPQWSQKHPVVACTTDELLRLRAAYRGNDSSRVPVEAVVKAAEEALKQSVTFPPRGGQHNQWYQCDTCQIALQTVDAGHHRCPKCKHVYTGEPYDDVIFFRVHKENLNRLKAAAWAYAITEEPQFADFAKRMLLGYAERYREYPFHSAGRGQTNWDKISGGHLFEQTLDEAVGLSTQIAPAYNLIYDASGMTPDDHVRIRDGLLIPMLENIDKYKGGKSNWQTWHNASMLWGGAVLGDASWITKAVTDPSNGFFRQLAVSVTDDGMWYENSWGYHVFTLSAMVEIAEGARRLNIDLWSQSRFKMMFTLPVRYAMPDGSLPRFGDDVKTDVGSVRRHIELAYNACRDESMFPYLSAEPTWDSVMAGRVPGKAGKAPAPGSEVFRGAGHALLRTTGEAGLTAAMTFGPYGGFHGHFDKLSFVFFGMNTELGVDPGRAASQAYRLPIHGNWYKATLSHNAVLVDRRSQAGVAGDLKLFTANATYAAALAACDEAYPGTRNRRLLVLTPGYLLVCDLLDSDKERRFDWLYHGRGADAVCDAATTKATPDAAFPGSEYIANAMKGVTDAAVRVQFRGKGVITHVTMAAEPGTEVLVGDGPGASVDDRVPLTRISRHGKQARFAAVLEPVRDIRPVVTQVLMTERDGAVHIEIRQGDSKDVVSLDGGNRLQVKRNDEVVLK